MREIINISLPPQIAAKIRHATKFHGFASVSEFFRHLWRQWEEKRIYRELMKGRKEIAMGLGKELKSLKDLR